MKGQSQVRGIIPGRPESREKLISRDLPRINSPAVLIPLTRRAGDAKFTAIRRDTLFIMDNSAGCAKDRDARVPSFQVNRDRTMRGIKPVSHSFRPIIVNQYATQSRSGEILREESWIHGILLLSVAIMRGKVNP